MNCSLTFGVTSFLTPPIPGKTVPGLKISFVISFPKNTNYPYFKYFDLTDVPLSLFTLFQQRIILDPKLYLTDWFIPKSPVCLFFIQGWWSCFLWRYLEWIVSHIFFLFSLQKFWHLFGKLLTFILFHNFFLV